MTLFACIECGRAENCDSIGHGVYCIDCLQNPANYMRFMGVPVPQYYVDDARERIAGIKYKLVKVIPRELPPLVVDDPGVKNPQHKTGLWPWRLFK